MNINPSKCTWHQSPRQSVLIHVASQNKKGCRDFYRTFRARPNDKSNTSKIEQKWHQQLGITLSVTFWDNAWRLHASITENNQSKWLQCQILRNSIFTNNRVSKFRNNVSDQCDLCGLHVENALTLFNSCDLTRQFWEQMRLFFLTYSHPLPILKVQILFGVHDEPFDSISNTAILLGKRVIWASKFRKTAPNIQQFKKSLKDYLVLLRYCNVIKNTSSIFDDQWGEICRALAGQDGAELEGGDD